MFAIPWLTCRAKYVAIGKIITLLVWNLKTLDYSTFGLVEGSSVPEERGSGTLSVKTSGL